VIQLTTRVQWHGSRAEGVELVETLSRHCSCEFTAQRLRAFVCAPHEMLISDQRAIDGLLFARRIAARLRSEEFRPGAVAADVAGNC
jgi:hypothetical protein